MSDKRMIQTVETHSGEPTRVITGGVGRIPGDSLDDPYPNGFTVGDIWASQAAPA